MMKAFVLKAPGGVENLQMEDVEKPEIRGNEVLVKTSAVSVNPVDIKTRKGEAQYANIKKYNPMILGWDISGTVEKVGAKVDGFKEGDEVFGMVNFPGHGRAYAEYVAAPASQIAVRPRNISHEECASACLAALTAWKALCTIGKVKRGQSVLIHGGSGGVGHYAVQIAKVLGANVYTTASGKNRDFMLSLGADVFIDYKTERFEDLTKKMDFILDSIGGENFRRSLSILKPNGVIVNLPTNKSEETKKIAEENNVKNFHQMLVESNGDDMRSIAELLALGRIKSHVFKTFRFKDIPNAHLRLERGGVVGKIAVKFH